jgi:aldehyde dehydrogenase (NAD+)
VAHHEHCPCQSAPLGAPPGDNDCPEEAPMDETRWLDLHRVHELQRAARWQVKNSTAEERIAKLERLKEVVLSHAEEVGAALHADLRRFDPTPMAQEVLSVLGDIDDAITNLASWMEPDVYEPFDAFGGATSVVRYEGRGNVLLFGPWNFPFNLIFQPLVPIIAAGNTAIVKPNEMSPHTSAVATTIIREAFDESDVAVFEGGVDLAEQLLQMPFDHIFFTGSPKVASTVMAAAAKHLASVTLELGGKCPAVVDTTTDLKAAAAAIAAGKHYNAGQICLSPDHLWVHEEAKEEFLAHYLAWVEENLYVDGHLNKAVFGRIVDARNFSRVTGYVEDAVARGAKLVGTGNSDEADLTIHPAVLLDVPADATVLQDEIFGPILPVLVWTDPTEVIEHVQSGGKPLAMYVFSQDEALVERLISETSTGGVTVNGWVSHYGDHRLPFGGVGTSGLGAYHSIHGFRELSHARAIVAHPTMG